MAKWHLTEIYLDSHMAHKENHETKTFNITECFRDILNRCHTSAGAQMEEKLFRHPGHYLSPDIEGLKILF